MLPKCRCVNLIVKPYQVNPYPGPGAPGRRGPQSGYNIYNSTTVGIRYLDFFPRSSLDVLHGCPMPPPSSSSLCRQTLQYIIHDIIGSSKLYIKPILSGQLISADIYDIIVSADEYIICDITGWAHDI